MKVWVQRVDRASVSVAGETVGEIGRGYLVLFGVAKGDAPEAAARLARRICSLRIFDDADGKTNLSIGDVGGSVLAVSQFTLYADTRHGNRPGFSAAARPEEAEPLYRRFVDELKGILGEARVATGIFRAEMKVELVNDGPFSVELLDEP